MTPADVLDLITTLTTAGKPALAEAVLAQLLSPIAPISPALPKDDARSSNAERCRRYRQRRPTTMSATMSHDTEAMSHDMVESMSHEVSLVAFPEGNTPMSPSMSSDMSQGMSVAVSQEGERGRGDYRGVGREGEIRVVTANSGTALTIRHTEHTGHMSHALTRSAPLAAVAGKLVSMADARERRESKHRGESELVFRYWQAKLGHTKAMYSRDREAKIVSRLREGATTDELCYAVDGIAKSQWHMGQNDNGVRYDGIEFLFRNRANVEKFAASQRGYRDGAPHPFVAEALAAVATASHSLVEPRSEVAHG